MSKQTYFKATQPNGTDFQTGTIDYGAALVSGGVVRHPVKAKIRDDAGTYLSVSVAAADCTGAQWPCRLFRVEPVGRVMAKLSASPNKRAVSALRVVEELPAHLSLGPNGEQVAEFIETCRKLTATDWKKVASAWDAAWDATRYATWDATRYAAWYAAWDATRYAAWYATWYATWDATWYATWGATRYAAWDAALAITTRDLITTEQYDLLTQPFVDAGFASAVYR